MEMKRCPDCGEKYSATYRKCPFCEEEDAIGRGKQIRRSGRGGKRSASRGGQLNLLTPTLVILILIMAALLMYLLFGENFKERAKKDPVETPGVEAVKPSEQPEKPAENPGLSGVTMPEDPEVPDDPEVQPPAEQPAESDYDKANKLPKGLTVNNPDFTLGKLGETFTIRASGGSGNYTWISEDDGIVSVDQSGKVTAISGGTVNVIVTDGSKKGVAIVRVSASGTLTPAPSGGGSGTTTSGLKAGDAKVINGGNGVNIRSGPGTSYDVLATAPNGADVKIIESASDGWYKIGFSDVGGVSKTGYMRGDFLANK